MKIDGEFVQHALSNRMDQLIIASLVRDLGVDYAQGYGVGRPVPLEEIFDRVRSVAVNVRGS